MHFLAEDPTYVLSALGLAVFGCLVALRVTQQGKFLVWAGVLFAVGLGFFGLEQVWVTDSERIEAVVVELGRAVEASDVDRIRAQLDSRVSLGVRGDTLDDVVPLDFFLNLIKRTHFDFVRISQLATEAGSQTRRGSAEFKVVSGGSVEEGGVHPNFGPLPTEWSLGFRETAPGQWKVTRITAINFPRYILPRRFR
jgi:hypothetical protein